MLSTVLRKDIVWDSQISTKQSMTRIQSLFLVTPPDSSHVEKLDSGPGLKPRGMESPPNYFFDVQILLCPEKFVLNIS